MPKPRLNRVWQNNSDKVIRNFNFSWSKPAMNIMTSDNAYIIELLIGKIDISNVDIDKKDGHLVISYKAPEASQDSKTQKIEYIYQEFVQDDFQRSFELPQDASNEIKASYGSGLLTINIEKKAKDETKTIKIDIED